MTRASIPVATVAEIRDSCLCFAAQRAARKLARRFDRLFAPLGITNQQFSLMVALAGAWQPRLGELAAFLGMDTTTMSAAVRPLQKAGLIALEADASDARARRPRLTEAGRGAIARAIPLWQEEHRRLEAEVQGDTVALSRQLAALAGVDLPDQAGSSVALASADPSRRPWRGAEGSDFRHKRGAGRPPGFCSPGPRSAGWWPADGRRVPGGVGKTA
jgi:DNA-binding MarR family transcriptional regulator